MAGKGDNAEGKLILRKLFIGVSMVNILGLFFKKSLYLNWRSIKKPLLLGCGQTYSYRKHWEEYGTEE